MTHVSPAPGVPQTSTKAVVAAASTALVAFLSALLPFLVDGAGLGDVTAAGWVTAVIAGLIGGGAVGGAVHQTANKVKV